jgi:hypothetical protein
LVGKAEVKWIFSEDFLEGYKYEFSSLTFTNQDLLAHAKE